MTSKCLLTAAFLAAIAPATGHAQRYPSKPVRIIVPYAPGGNVDLIARAIAPGVGGALGQQIIVENRPGSSALVGTHLVAKSTSDGYTLLAMANTFAVVPSIVSEPGYEPLRDFTAITLTCLVPQVLVVNTALPVRSVQQLIALARSHPGEMSYASSGVGATGHMAAELFNRQVGVKMLHVPYKGNAQAIVDVISGQVTMMFDQVSTSSPHVKAGKLRALAVTSLKRSPLFPNVPTIDESGAPKFEDITFNGLVAPSGTPREILIRIRDGVAKAVADPALRGRFLERGVELVASASPEEFTALIRTEFSKKAKLARDAGIKIE